MSDELLNWRPPTAAEKDIKFLNSNIVKDSPMLLFRQKIDKVSQEYMHKKKEPFCGRCAQLDYKEQLEKAKKEMHYKVGYTEFDKLPKSNDFDLKPYADKSRFTFLKENKIVKPGKWKHGSLYETTYNEYRCNMRGCQFAIQIKEEKYEDNTQEVSNMPKFEIKGK